MSKRAIPSRLPTPSDQLADLIRHSGRPPAAIAAAAGVAPSVLSRFLTGSRGIHSDTFDRLALALGGLRLVAISAGRRGRQRLPRPATRAQVEAAAGLPDPLPDQPPATRADPE
jgi:hypothetical protein